IDDLKVFGETIIHGAQQTVQTQTQTQKLSEIIREECNGPTTEEQMEKCSGEGGVPSPVVASTRITNPSFGDSFYYFLPGILSLLQTRNAKIVKIKGGEKNEE
ncbi:MAG: hypothetical protein ACPL1Y_05845, partial [Thermoplasmata archaeon]